MAGGSLITMTSDRLPVFFQMYMSGMHGLPDKALPTTMPNTAPIPNASATSGQYQYDAACNSLASARTNKRWDYHSLRFIIDNSATISAVIAHARRNTHAIVHKVYYPQNEGMGDLHRPPPGTTGGINGTTRMHRWCRCRCCRCSSVEWGRPPATLSLLR